MAPYNLFDSACFFSKLMSFAEFANACAPPNPPFTKVRNSDILYP